jgi:hypothetical protein
VVWNVNVGVLRSRVKSVRESRQKIMKSREYWLEMERLAVEARRIELEREKLNYDHTKQEFLYLCKKFNKLERDIFDIISIYKDKPGMDKIISALQRLVQS